MRLPILIFLFLTPISAWSQEPVTLVTDPALSPDGKMIAFAWKEDIWTASTSGGTIRQLTRHEAIERQPFFSPDGKEIAFVSERSGSRQVWVLPVKGGTAVQVTDHTAGHSLHGWYPDGKSLLIRRAADSYWRNPYRFWKFPLTTDEEPTMLFDARGNHGDLNSDASKIIFTREGEQTFRKGYTGPRARQIWMYDLATAQFQKLIQNKTESRWPLWKREGKGFYFVGGESGSLNLRETDQTSLNASSQLVTQYKDDTVTNPALSRDGSTIVFSHLFDLYRMAPGSKPEKINLLYDGDTTGFHTKRKTLKKASEAAFTDDVLEIALIAGGDLWVMDTVLKEPHRITNTPGEESEPIFSKDRNEIYYLSEQEGQSDIWVARRSNAKKYWWQNDSFVTERITHDEVVEGSFTLSPDGKSVAFVRDRSQLIVRNIKKGTEQVVVSSWNWPSYDWSPDSKWMVYSIYDHDYNRDIWIAPVDGSQKPVNVSRHPDNETNPTWSPDGKMIAFTGRRSEKEIDIYYLWLTKEDHEKSKREKDLKKALETMTKGRKKKAEPKAPEKKSEKVPEKKKKPIKKKDDHLSDEHDKPKPKKKEDPAPKQEKKKETAKKKDISVKIDFEDIHLRLKRVSLPDSSEDDLFWSHDSKKLGFSSTIKGKRGTWTVSMPNPKTPAFLSTSTVKFPNWISKGNQILGVIDGLPGSLSASGSAKKYSFSVRVEVDLVAHRREGFFLAWRAMRDIFYDVKMGNRDWDKIRTKYEDAAATAPDARSFGNVINMMLGELNASHLGFNPATSSASGPGWTEVTPHLGIRWDPNHPGPGLRIRDILPGTPAAREIHKLEAGEVVTKIDGKEVTPSTRLTSILNGRLDRDIILTIVEGPEKTREVTLRAISYTAIHEILYRKWIRDNREKVDQASKGTLGYLHVRSMNWSSFLTFERDLYAAGAGKDGLVIDVRENGGGFTADYLLTALTQPLHAITVGRGGAPGYPQDRKVYASWNKPIIVLCNQNSFSNAEIFTHAIKTLKRGKVVGVQTAGGVISTSGRRIMDLGFIRTPMRGWYVVGTGEDMELNGAVPDVTLWPEPGEIPAGKDVQLSKAIELLIEDVRKWKARPQPKLRNASDR